MNLRDNIPHRRPQNPAYRQAFARLEEALEESKRWDNAERIRSMREAYFADVDESVKSGRIQLPKKDH